MSHLLLAHLSQDNNRPELAQGLFEAHAGGTTITIASRYNESEVYAIDGSYLAAPGPDWNPQGTRRSQPEPAAASAAAEPPAIPRAAVKKRKALTPSKNPATTQTSLF